MGTDSEQVHLSPREQLVVSRLQREFLNRARKNPRYSLRAFAQSAKIDQSHLTKIFSGKVRLSKNMIFHISSFLGLKLQDLSKTETLYNNVADETFEIISNWIHFALMELIKTHNFKGDTVWMAKKLGVHTQEVQTALNRLIKLGIIEKKGKQYTITTKDLRWDNDEKTTLARKLLQKELLKKATESIDRVEFSKREHSSLTFSIPTALIPELKKEIQKFRDKIDQISEQEKEREQVYQLCISLFPLTEGE